MHESDELKNYVIEKLKLGWSPKTIAGRTNWSIRLDATITPNANKGRIRALRE